MVDKTILLSSVYIVSGTMSIVGSGLILFLIFQDRKTRKRDKRNNYMIMAALSFFDLILSFVLGYGWLFYPDGKHPWAQGNDNTCMGHTFLMTLGFASTYYNGSLAVYYLLVVKFTKTAEWMLKWAMPSLVGLPAIYAITMTATCLSLGSYGFDGEFCGWCGWVDDNAVLGWAASWGPICISVVLQLACMAVIVHAIYINEKTMRDRYDFATSVEQSQQNNQVARLTMTRKTSSVARLKMTRKTSNQAMWYIGAFFITYVWSFVASFLQAYGSSEVPFFVWFLRALFQPLQGLLNFIIFYRGYSKEGNTSSAVANYTKSSSFWGRWGANFKKSQRNSNASSFSDEIYVPDLENITNAGPNNVEDSQKRSEDAPLESN